MKACASPLAPLVSTAAWIALLFALLASICAPAVCMSALRTVQSTQIDWQRDLQTARTLSSVHQRPLLVAINVDGESSSERIVVERYRDPAFVASTRGFVCVLGSPVRHNPRDADELGRRIECPRFGQVTCGEHIALEPAIFEAHLAEPRVSPRHALVDPGGAKRFDLYYLFDMRELDRALLEAGRTLEPWSRPRADDSALARGDLVAWRKLADDRSARARAQALAAFDALVDEAAARAALRAAAESNPDLTLELCVAAIGRPVASRVLQAEAFRRAREAQRLEELCAWARWLRSSAPVRRGAEGRFVHAPELARPWSEAQLTLDELLARHWADDDAGRPWLLAILATGDAPRRAAVERGLRAALGEDPVAALRVALQAEGGQVELEAALQASRLWACMDLPSVAAEPPAAPADPVLQLAEAEAAVDATPDDPRAMARLGAASLALARTRIESGQPGADLLLRDARAWHDRALAAGADSLALSAQRARVAYLLGDFAEQACIAAEALGARQPADGPRGARLRSWLSSTGGAFVLAAEDPGFAEDARWLADAGLRLAATAPAADSALGAPRDPGEEIASIARTLRAAAATACSSSAGESDWLALASAARIWFGVAAECAVLEAAVARLPASNALRAALHDAGWRLGRVEWAVDVARRVARLHPPAGAADDGVALWYLGSAELFHAEVLRRQLRVEEALAAGERAARAFESAQAHAWLSDSARAWRARSHLSRAHALLLRRAETESADELVQAASIDAGSVVGGILGPRDGLERDLPDAIDGIFEWRLGRASRVDGPQLARRLDAALVDDLVATQVLSMVADALLREALRDDGREGAEASFEQLVRDEDDPRTHWETRPGRLPTFAGDGLMRQAIEVARMAAARSGGGESARRALAQTLSVAAQRAWTRGERRAALPHLMEAASLLGREPGTLDEVQARELLHALRSELGPARPVPRPGR